MSGIIDFSKIPNDRPAAVHFETLGQALTFLSEFSDMYPKKTRNWDEINLRDRFETYNDFCLNPYMNEPGENMCYCSIDYYEDEDYVILEFDDIVMSVAELPIEQSDMPLDSLFGI